MWHPSYRAGVVVSGFALMLLGYHVIRVSYGQVMHGWPEVQEQIMQAVAQGLHRAQSR